MAFKLNHVHLKTPDPKATAKFYMDNYGATYKQDMPNGTGVQLDLHGLQLNITTKIPTQNHAQHYGIEHLAVTTNDYTAELARLRANGVEVLEELTGSSGLRVAFLASPDGAQMEIIETK
jgi:catechol 2,3-dioxygenase-like lactoylglutathione lyase family enzyme